MIRPTVWQVIWIDADGRGHGACGHRHASADEATSCPWEPERAPLVSSGLVRKIRDPDYHVLREGPARSHRRPQLDLALGVA